MDSEKLTIQQNNKDHFLSGKPLVVESKQLGLGAIIQLHEDGRIRTTFMSENGAELVEILRQYGGLFGFTRFILEKNCGITSETKRDSGELLWAGVFDPETMNREEFGKKISEINESSST